MYRSMLVLFTATVFAPVAYAGFGYRFEGQANWWWEASADGGATWSQTIISVPQSQSSIRVRATCSFPPVFGYYFGGAMIDQTITGVHNSSIGDTATVLNVGFNNQQTIGVTRFGNVLKIDDASDSLPPGQGASHLGIFQPQPALGPFTLANPVTNLVVFNLHLDGSLGDRVVDAWWRSWEGYLPGMPDVSPAIFVYNRNLNDTDLIFPSLTVNPLTIRVVPVPGIPAIALIATVLVARRRRANRHW
jgi:hypothetical protein